jgi:hypothetical protein
MGWGQVCKACRGGRCVDPPTRAQPLVLSDGPCSACDGDPARSPTCPQCGGWGRDVVTSCPTAMILPGTVDAIEAAAMGAKRILPCTGGFLDQSASYVAAVRFVWAEEAYWRATLNVPSDD